MKNLVRYKMGPESIYLNQLGADSQFTENHAELDRSNCFMKI